MGIQKSLSLIIFCYLISGCAGNPSEELSIDYLDSLKAWKIERHHEVTKSWIPLVGLKWLKEGENTFGSDTSNQLVFPSSAPSYLGKFYLSGDTVVMSTNPEIEILINDSLTSDHEFVVDESKIIKSGTIEWTVIQRVERHAVRIWDRSTVNIDAFQLDYFEPDSKWIIAGEFESYPEGKTYPIANVVGSVTDTPIPGKLNFEFDDKRYSLDVMEGEKDTWFVIFGDETNGEATYGAGRYLYVFNNENGEKVVIDFNRAYNPPCAFTEFATCPLPPAQNRLPFPVLAGEKISVEDH